MARFEAPCTIEELCNSLKNKDNNTYIIAGGTDLIIHFNKKGIFGYNIIDLTKLKELKEINETDEEIIIGSCVTMTEIENNPLINAHVPALIDAVYNLGSQQIRNKATIGGNVANSSQSGDTIPVLFAYDANVEIIDPLGNRRIEKVENVVEGLEKNNLNFDEVITKIIIKKNNAKSAFSKIGSRKAVTISKLNCCVKIKINNNIIEDSVVYLGAVGPKPIRAKSIEEKILNKNINNIVSADIHDAIYMEIENAIPNRTSKHYKKSAAEGLIDDILNKLRR
ncbi:carbon-monoxide dehydrogenase medium subunit [Sedimentibacter acidaminivorans]|uniref:Carbon-monoxide dehydrogenase medium subunit n=1 Tax=Sedimentibacter acidaminivorans TaxID=913099 RepID=A0ABS4GD76_9FIRM|nr:FAD binding domain-containing protein [Sedimentibacter acidaminivorans]MBP1925655.1 carbon-monoxide dehydrogenase medium subunit [Sedimentibacter acidaminivorans]